MYYACSCRHCNKLFRSPIRRTVCDECRHLDEELFERIEKYLMLYPNSNAIQVAEGLSVDVMDIIRFIDEGRLKMVKGTFSKL